MQNFEYIKLDYLIAKHSEIPIMGEIVAPNINSIARIFVIDTAQNKISSSDS